jgi:hypothetical protein
MARRSLGDLCAGGPGVPLPQVASWMSAHTKLTERIRMPSHRLSSKRLHLRLM